MSQALVPTFFCAAKLHAFKAERDDRRFPAYMSLRQVLDAYGIVPGNGSLYDYYISDTGIPIHESQWGVHWPKPGAVVALCAMPAGGAGRGDSAAKNMVRIAGMFALMAGVPAGLGAMGLNLGAGATAGAKALGALTTGAALWGWNQLCSPPDQNQIGIAPEPSIGFSARATPYQAMPRVYGRIRFHPPMACRPYVHKKAEGTDVYFLYWVSFGPVRITQVKIGDIGIADVPGIDYEIVAGSDSDHTRNIAPPIIVTQEWTPSENIAEGGSTLTWGTDQHTHSAVIYLNFADGLFFCPLNHVDNLTFGSPARLRIKLRFRVYAEWPPGSGSYSSARWVKPVEPAAASDDYSYVSGINSVAKKVHFRLDLVDEFSDWLEVQDGYAEGEPTRFFIRIYRYDDSIQSKNGPPHWGAWFDPDDYEAREMGNDTKLVKCESLEWGDPIREDHIDPDELTHIGTIGIRVRIEEARGLRWDAVSCLAESYLPWWNGSEWHYDAHLSYRGHVDAVLCDIFKGKATSKALRVTDDAKLDLVNIQAWGDWCRTEGFYFNGVFDRTRTMRDALSAVCFTGRASPTMIDGKHAVVYDYNRYAAGTEPVMVLTPRNSWGLTCTRQFPDDLHGIRVQYRRRGADDSYKHEERFILRDGVGIHQATNVIKQEFFGVTEDAEVDKHAAYMLNCARLRLEIWKTHVRPEFLIMNRGDLVVVSDDVPMIGNKRGRIKTVVKDSNDAVTAVTLDEPVYLDSTNYKLRVMSSNRFDTPHWHSYRTPAITYPGTPAWVDAGDELAFVTAIDAPSSANPDAAQPEAGDNYVYGHEETPDVKIERHYLTTAIRPDAEMGGELTLIEEASNRREDPSEPGVYDLTTGTTYMPDVQWEPFLEYWDPLPVSILSITTDETVLFRGPDGTPLPQIALQLDYSTGEVGGQYAPVNRLDIQFRETPGDGEDGPWLNCPSEDGAPQIVYIRGVQFDRIYDVRVRSRSEHNRVSLWAEELSIEIEGMTNPPPAPTGISLEDEGRMLCWTYPDPAPLDLRGFEIRYQSGEHAGDVATGWAAARRLNAQPVTGTSLPLSPWFAGEFTFFVAALDIVGNYSDPIAMIVNFPDPDDLPYLDVSPHYNWRENNWPNWNGEGSENCYRHADGSLAATNPQNEMVYVSSGWTYTIGVGYGDRSGTLIVIPEVDCDAVSWFIEYQTAKDWVDPGWTWPDDWHPWLGRAALKFRQMPGGLTTWTMGIRFRVVCRGQTSGQAKIQQLSFRRAFPQMIELFEHAYNYTDFKAHILTKSFSHIMEIRGTVIDPGATSGIPTVYQVRYSQTESRPWFVATFIQFSGAVGDADLIRWTIKGFSSYAGYNDPPQILEDWVGDVFENERT